MKFLIADDSPAKMEFLRGLVQRVWKGEIVTAETTEDARDVIDLHPDIGAAFIDYYIPSSRGPAIIRHLKQKIPTAHIALVSSSNSQKNANEAREAGAHAVVCTSGQSDVVEKELLGLIEEWKH